MLLVVSGMLALVPGPNVLAYFFAFRVVGHWLSMRGARQGLHRARWVGRACPILTRLRGAGGPADGRARGAIQEVASRAGSRPAAALRGADAAAAMSAGVTIPHVKLRDLAARLDCRLDGDGDVEISGVAGIHEAGPGDVTFLANAKYQKALAATSASAVILRDDGSTAPCAVLRARDPYLAFARAVGVFAPDDRPAPGVHALAAIAADARARRRRCRSGRSCRSAPAPRSARAR